MGAILITLGGMVELWINGNDHLIVVQKDEAGNIDKAIDLGLATRKRLDNLQDYLERLKVHAVAELH
jgi:hypothetical protein